MKIFIGICCFILSVFVSIELVDKYKKRFIFYNELYSFLNILKNEVSFNCKKLKNIIDNLNNKNFTKILNKIIFVNQELKERYLSIDENKYIEEVLKSIGKTDRNSQIDFIDEIMNVIKDKKILCENEYKKNKTLYIKIGILIGLVLFIALI